MAYVDHGAGTHGHSLNI